MVQQRADALRAICRARWLGLLVAVLAIAIYYHDFPAGYRRFAFGLIAVYALANFGIWWRTRGRIGADRVSSLSMQSLALDLLAVSAFVATFLYDSTTPVRPLIYVLPLVGALLYQQRGALGMMAVAGALYASSEYLSAFMHDYDFRPLAVSFRLGIGFIIASVAGGIASHLENQSDRVIRSERRIARINDRLTTVLANLPGMAYRARNDDAWTLDFVSEGAAGLTGYTAEEFLSQPDLSFGSLIHPEDRPRVREEMKPALESGSPFQLEYRIVARDGSEKWVWEQARPVPDPEHGFAIEGLIIDATDRKRLEGELARSQKMEAVGRLAGGIAHDFNNLLAVVTSYAVLVSDDLPEDSPLREDLSEIHKAGQRGAALVRQLLAFSKNQVVAPQVLEVDAVVQEMTNLLSKAVGEHIELKTRLSADRPVLIDRGQLEQILMNLVVNARDAMADGGTITIESSVGTHPCDGEQSEGAREDCVSLSVVDTGQGIPPEVMEHIFEPFFTTKEKGGGTGLGLATTYGIVDKAGGRVDITSELGRGTRVQVYLPVVDQQSPVIDLREKTDAAAAHHQGCTILVVEDEDPVRQVIERILTKDGHEVLTAASGREALDQVGSHEVDLVITDVMMPGLSGHGFVQELRDRGDEPEVIYISGYDREVVSGKTHELQAHDVLIQKPFSAEDLLGAVSQKLNRSTTGS